MNVIDLEILIPASPEFIWRFMGDLSAIPQWQDDVVSVSFLSTQREGRGARWRQSTVKGGDAIVEVSAWYDTLGYEYRVVDGSTYRDNQGRIRLHEVTDGTLVRWTFQYEAGGVLGGLRNSMRLKRGATNLIQESLRNLHQLIVQESGGISTHEAKATMQEAPDARERSSYQPRHPSAIQDSETDDIAIDEDTTLSEHLPLSFDPDMAPEALPAVLETDTKPNPVVLSAGLGPISEAEPKPDDTQPIEVESLLAEIRAPDDDLAPVKAEPLAPPPAGEAREDRPPPSLEDAGGQSDDSSNLSVFEIFGLQKPSEAQGATAGDAASESLNDYPIREKRATPISDTGFSEQIKPEEPGYQARQTADAEAARGKISGWRRGARRRKPALRTHT